MVQAAGPSVLSFGNNMKKWHKAVIVACAVYAVAHVIILRHHHQTHVGYLLWKIGAAPRISSYDRLFRDDYRYLASWNGKPIESLLRRFPEMNDGSHFPADSYRGKIRDRQAKYGGYSFYWFDDLPQKWGWCAKVKDGDIVGIMLIKG